MTSPPAYAGYRKIVHIRIDAFYASVAQRDDPRLAERPVLVIDEAGGDAIVAVSCEARQRGVHPPMAVKRALHLCPGAACVPADFDQYLQISAEFFELLCAYTDLVEAVEADRAILDVTYNKLDIPFSARIAKMIKSDIKRELGLGTSIGVGPNKFIAKLAAQSARPDAFCVVRNDEVAEFLRDVPTDRIPGVGARTRQRLAEMDIGHIGQLAQVPLDELVQRLGQRAQNLWLLAQGRDDEPVTPAEQPNQIGQEELFATAVYKPDEMQNALRELAAELGGRLRRRSLRGRLVLLRVDYPNFRTTTRSLRLAEFTDQPQTLCESAIELLGRTEAYAIGVRRLGIGLGGFVGEAVEQLDLFATTSPIQGEKT